MSSLRIPYTKCPLCHGTDFGPIVKADCTRHALWQEGLPTEMVWMQCNDCKHVFAEGVWTPEAETLVFSRTHEFQKFGFGLEEQRPMWSRVVENVIRASWSLPSPMKANKWLDIGFGSGGLLLAAAEFGFDPYGTESRIETLEAAERSPFPLNVAETISDFPGKTFEVVSACDVIEHVGDPNAFLDTIESITEPGSVVLISTPNIDSPVWKFLDARNANPYWMELEHYHIFGTMSLYLLLTQRPFVLNSYHVSERYRACIDLVLRRT